MKSIQQFYGTNHPPLFKNTQHLPQFFEINLQDSARVVKVFHNDPQANIRIFYYQYLKLCFQLDNINFSLYINKIEQLINNQNFKFMFLETDDPEIYNDNQFKRLIMEFFGLLAQEEVDIQQMINDYIFIDTVFVYFFRAFLILTGKTDSLDSYMDKQQLLGCLCEYFEVEINFHQNCIKYVQADIFVYEQHPKQVYMAYMDQKNYKENIQEQSNQYKGSNYVEGNLNNVLQKVQMITSQAIQPQPSPAKSPLQYSNENNNIRTFVNTSYIASEFIDYTSSPPVNLSHYAKDNLQSSGDYSEDINRSRNNSAKTSQQDDIYKSGEPTQYQKASFDQKQIIIMDPSWNVNDSISQNVHNPNKKTIQSQSKITNIQTKANDKLYYNNQSYSQYYNAIPNTAQPTTDKYSINYNKKYPQTYPSYYKDLQVQIKQNNNYNNYKQQQSNYSNILNNYEGKNIIQDSRKIIGQYKFKIKSQINNTFDISTSKKQVENSSRQIYNYEQVNKLQRSKIQYQPIYASNYDRSQHLLINNYNNNNNNNSISETNVYKGFTMNFNKKPLSQYQAEHIQKDWIKKPSSSIQTNQYNLLNTNKYKEYDQFIVQSTKIQTDYQYNSRSDKNSPFGLDVSHQFTNSITMKAMVEPHRNNVRQIREKARNYRNSLYNFLK